jgi:hypothetical protein
MQVHKIKETYNAEIALIILCCRNYIQTADKNSLQLFIKETKIDWKKVYRLSKAHRIRTIIYKVLDSFRETIYAENLNQLRNFSMYFNAYALNNKRELLRILNLLKQQNISGKPFKGVDFSEKIYGNIGLREFSDNDIIIKEKDIKRVIELMLKEGYESKDIAFYKKFPKQYVRDYKDLLFEKFNGDNREFAFEFHFKTSRYFQGYPYSFAEIIGDDYLDDKRNYNKSDYLKIITLSNGLTDLYPNVRSLLDLAIILKDAEYLVNKVDVVLKPYLNFGILLSSNLLNLNIDETKITMAPKEIKFYNYLQDDILALEEGKRKPLSKFFYFNLINSTSLKAKLDLIKKNLQLIIRPGLHDINKYKFNYFFLYYFTKPFRILRKSRK